LGKKQSTISPFLNFDLPVGNKVQMFEFTKGFILNDSCPFKITTSNFPSLVVLNLLLANLVKFFFFEKVFFNLAFIGASVFKPKIFRIYGKMKNLKQAAVEIGFPGKPNITFDLPLNFANNIGLPGLIKIFLNEWDTWNFFITFGIKSNLPAETAPEVIIILVLEFKIFNNFL